MLIFEMLIIKLNLSCVSFRIVLDTDALRLYATNLPLITASVIEV